jgi:hypothetical protein
MSYTILHPHTACLPPQAQRWLRHRSQQPWSRRRSRHSLACLPTFAEAAAAFYSDLATARASRQSVLDHSHGQACVDPTLRVVGLTVFTTLITNTLLTQRCLHNQTNMVRHCAGFLASRLVLNLADKVPAPLFAVLPTRGSFRDPRFCNPGQTSSRCGGTPSVILLRAHLWFEVARGRQRDLPRS